MALVTRQCSGVYHGEIIMTSAVKEIRDEVKNLVVVVGVVMVMVVLLSIVRIGELRLWLLAWVKG